MTIHINDPVTITIKFERPATEAALARAISDMIAAVPAGRDGNVRFRANFDGVPEDLAASLETAFALGKAQMAVKAARKRK